MKTDNLVESLKRYGIRAASYVRPPVAKEVFALTILPNHSEGVITVNQGQARVDIVGSKKLRQAAVTVRESGRVVTRQVNGRFAGKIKPTKDQAFDRLRKNFSVLMPSNATWDVTDITYQKVNPLPTVWNRFPEPSWNISGKVTATVKERTVNHFLMGMDETRNFIAPIAHQVKSVKEAHRLLKAPETNHKSKVIRQGEWFFIPCDKRTSHELDKIVYKKAGTLRRIQLGDTTHTAKTAIQFTSGDKKTEGVYARGFVADRRTGHHEPLFLPKWHKVVKNKEATIKVSSFQKEAAARRRSRTWD